MNNILNSLHTIRTRKLNIENLLDILQEKKIQQLEGKSKIENVQGKSKIEGVQGKSKIEGVQGKSKIEGVQENTIPIPETNKYIVLDIDSLISHVQLKPDKESDDIYLRECENYLYDVWIDGKYYIQNLNNYKIILYTDKNIDYVSEFYENVVNESKIKNINPFYLYAIIVFDKNHKYKYDIVNINNMKINIWYLDKKIILNDTTITQIQTIIYNWINQSDNKIDFYSDRLSESKNTFYINKLVL